LRQAYHRLKWKLVSVCFEIVLNLMQVRWTVYTKHTIGSDIILDAPDGNSYVIGSCVISVHLETVLVSVHDMCTICAKRTIGSKIVLDAPDGTPR
jgi:hypothetical protein